MTTKELLHRVTSFANMHIAASRIRIIAGQTGAEYIGNIVIETLPNGTTQEAMIMQTVWDASVGLHGDWMIYIAYTDPQAAVPGAWLGREVLTLKDGG